MTSENKSRYIARQYRSTGPPENTLPAARGGPYGGGMISDLLATAAWPVLQRVHPPRSAGRSGRDARVVKGV
ncbi:hypothetical protein ABT299_16070 [Spirillospora sp. NPDC000708]|jgi:hypothetical protein